MLISLDEIPPAWILKGREDAVWHYSVVKDDKIMLGSEKLLTVIPEEQFDELLTGMQEAVREQQRRHPETSTKDLTEQDLKNGIDGLGHPTIAVEFSDDGGTLVAPAALSGEFRYDPRRQLGTINDQSGRYMSKAVRPGVDPGQVEKWLENACKVFEKKLGIPVTYEQTKTLPDQPTNSTVAHTAALQTTGNASPAANTPSQPTTFSAPGAPPHQAAAAVTKGKRPQRS
ncbi:hypothetical protein AAW14_24925 [Streptomyces hygroscopicus]|nr:hypothetical protein [Streptomyces hygroscopicus]